MLCIQNLEICFISFLQQTPPELNHCKFCKNDTFKITFSVCLNLTVVCTAAKISSICSFEKYAEEHLREKDDDT